MEKYGLCVEFIHLSTGFGFVLISAVVQEILRKNWLQSCLFLSLRTMRGQDARIDFVCRCSISRLERNYYRCAQSEDFEHNAGARCQNWFIAARCLPNSNILISFCSNKNIFKNICSSICSKIHLYPPLASVCHH